MGAVISVAEDVPEPAAAALPERAEEEEEEEEAAGLPREPASKRRALAVFEQVQNIDAAALENFMLEQPPAIVNALCRISPAERPRESDTIANIRAVCRDEAFRRKHERRFPRPLSFQKFRGLRSIPIVLNETEIVVLAEDEGRCRSTYLLDHTKSVVYERTAAHTTFRPSIVVHAAAPRGFRRLKHLRGDFLLGFVKSSALVLFQLVAFNVRTGVVEENFELQGDIDYADNTYIDTFVPKSDKFAFVLVEYGRYPNQIWFVVCDGHTAQRFRGIRIPSPGEHLEAGIESWITDDLTELQQFTFVDAGDGKGYVYGLGGTDTWALHRWTVDFGFGLGERQRSVQYDGIVGELFGVHGAGEVPEQLAFWTAHLPSGAVLCVGSWHMLGEDSFYSVLLRSVRPEDEEGFYPELAWTAGKVTKTRVYRARDFGRYLGYEPGWNPATGRRRPRPPTPLLEASPDIYKEQARQHHKIWQARQFGLITRPFNAPFSTAQEGRVALIYLDQVGFAVVNISIEGDLTFEMRRRSEWRHLGNWIGVQTSRGGEPLLTLAPDGNRFFVTFIIHDDATFKIRGDRLRNPF